MGCCIARAWHGRGPAVAAYEARLGREGRVVAPRRNPRMRNKLLAHFGECQACGVTARRVLEGAHVRAKDPETGFYDNGAANLLVLCANCHTLFDKGDAAESAAVAGHVQRRYPCLQWRWRPEHRLRWWQVWCSCPCPRSCPPCGSRT